MDRNESIKTNDTTGGKKATKLARFDLIPAEPLIALAEHYGKGAQKYDANNWRKGYEWSSSFSAMMRHAWLFWNGEDIDPETGSHHLTAVAWHAFAMQEWTKTHPEMDDRSKSESEHLQPEKSIEIDEMIKICGRNMRLSGTCILKLGHAGDHFTVDYKEGCQSGNGPGC